MKIMFIICVAILIFAVFTYDKWSYKKWYERCIKKGTGYDINGNYYDHSKGLVYYKDGSVGKIDAPQKCKGCDYSDICIILETPSDEACEAIRACTKEYLYEQIFNSLYEYFNKPK